MTNKIPDGSKLVFDPGFVFNLWGLCLIHNNKTIHVEGYGATLIRGDQIQDWQKSTKFWVRVVTLSDGTRLCMLQHTTELIE